jgi:hypothetical protein
VEGSYEHGNEPLGSIKSWEIVEWPSNWLFPKKGSALWSQLVRGTVDSFKGNRH